MNFQTKKYSVRLSGINRKTNQFEIYNVMGDSVQDAMDTFSLTHMRIVPLDSIEMWESSDSLFYWITVMKINSNVDLLNTIQENSVGKYLPDEISKIVVNVVLQRNEHKVLTINSFNSWFYWYISLEGIEYWEPKFKYLLDKVNEDRFK